MDNSCHSWSDLFIEGVVRGWLTTRQGRGQFGEGLNLCFTLSIVITDSGNQEEYADHDLVGTCLLDILRCLGLSYFFLELFPHSSLRAGDCQKSEQWLPIYVTIVTHHIT